MSYTLSRRSGLCPPLFGLYVLFHPLRFPRLTNTSRPSSTKTSRCRFTSHVRHFSVCCAPLSSPSSPYGSSVSSNPARRYGLSLLVDPCAHLPAVFVQSPGDRTQQRPDYSPIRYQRPGAHFDRDFSSLRPGIGLPRVVFGI